MNKRLLSLALAGAVALGAAAPATAAPALAPATAQAGQEAGADSARLDGASNFRDLSGEVPGINSGVLYRSNKLNKLSDADLRKLTELGVRTDVDLRTLSERTQEPDRLPEGVRYEVADVLVTPVTSEPPASADAAEAWMIETYRDFIRKDSANAAYRKLFLEAAKSGDGNALVYHCTAGKDRTGWGSAILLLAAGVSKDAVERDYLASNDRLAEDNAKILAPLPADQQEALKPILDVRPQYLAAAFDEMNKKYGSFDAYLHEGLKLTDADIDRLKSALRG
ncbi:tyrosine-protein phosphatase [Streptomyces sp. Da 82-17]|uniref:tyrosine-protein phosphatase n=1 Tax=Streptomyces sp. Da 82-17 TaxID=3377116 RepID=UPI0038D489DD